MPQPTGLLIIPVAAKTVLPSPTKPTDTSATSKASGVWSLLILSAMLYDEIPTLITEPTIATPLTKRETLANCAALAEFTCPLGLYMFAIFLL